MADASTGEAAPAATEATETTTTTETKEVETDHAAESAKWKELSRKNERELRKAQAELAKVQQSSMSETEKAVAEAKAQAKAEALAEIQLERVRDKVAIAAAGKLADPQDASALLGDLEQFVVSGEIDSKAISSAIDRLLEAKPYLGAQPGAGSAEGGPRGSSKNTPLNGDPLVRDLERKLGVPR